MEFSDIDQDISSIDWFAVDSEGNIAHFTSGGGTLPLSIASSVENNTLLVEYFRLLDEKSFLVSQVPAEVNEVEQIKLFLSYHGFYSSRGLYSFTRNEISADGQWRDFEYSLVTVPEQPLLLDVLPMRIRAIISTSSYNGYFRKEKIVYSNFIT